MELKETTTQIQDNIKNQIEKIKNPDIQNLLKEKKDVKKPSILNNISENISFNGFIKILTYLKNIHKIYTKQKEKAYDKALEATLKLKLKQNHKKLTKLVKTLDKRDKTNICTYLEKNIPLESKEKQYLHDMEEQELKTFVKTAYEEKISEEKSAELKHEETNVEKSAELKHEETNVEKSAELKHEETNVEKSTELKQEEAEKAANSFAEDLNKAFSTPEPEKPVQKRKIGFHV